jgi:hypothetical protein
VADYLLCLEMYMYWIWMDHVAMILYNLAGIMLPRDLIFPGYHGDASFFRFSATYRKDT